MEADFWHNKWQRNEIGFHNGDIHPLLIRYWPQLQLAEQSRVLVPMAGKSLDLCWLLDQEHPVTAVELSELAVESFFTERGWPAQPQTDGQHRRYQHQNLDFWVGDFFALRDHGEIHVDAVYDRAALIALPPTMRGDYVDTVSSLLKPGGRYLLISLEYEQGQAGGPPFAIDAEEIQQLFGEKFTIECKGRHASDLRGTPCFETVYLMQRKGE